MTTFNKLYFNDYTGETIVLTRIMEDGEWKEITQEYTNNLPNINSTQAVVFGNGVSRLDFPHRYVTRRSGEKYEINRLTTYSCNAAMRDFETHYLIVTHKGLMDDLIHEGYINAHWTFSISTLVSANTFLIPQNLNFDAGSLAVSLAAFNQHKVIYLLGFDGQDTPEVNNNVYADTENYDSRNTDISDVKWVHNMGVVFNTFNDTKFIRVTQSKYSTVPELWKYCTNFEQVDFRDFIRLANL